jgi:hypothetical protein
VNPRGLLGLVELTADIRAEFDCSWEHAEIIAKQQLRAEAREEWRAVLERRGPPAPGPCYLEGDELPDNVLSLDAWRNRRRDHVGVL